MTSEPTAALLDRMEREAYRDRFAHDQVHYGTQMRLVWIRARRTVDRRIIWLLDGRRIARQDIAGQIHT